MERFIFFISLIFIFFLPKGYSADYYWVGGSGDWSDISHWATSSGGTVKYSVTPSASDNVFFDENSFPTSGAIVTINNDIAFASNLTFRNISTNPTFRAGANTTLTIYGSLTLISQMTFQHLGNIHFLGSTTTRTINFANHNAAANILFNGTGSWNLISNLIVGNLLEINQGTVSFGNNQVTTQFFKSSSNLQRVINFDNARFRITGISDFLSNFWLEDPRNKFTLHINSTNWSSTSNGARIEFSSSFNHLFVSSNGSIELPAILASSTFGLTEIINDQKTATIRINGDLDIRHDGVINSSLTLQNLILAPGFNYTLLGGGMYSINSIISTGTCSSMASLSSNPVGLSANINLTAPTNLTFTILQDLKISGAPATANNSINLGNNSGITITEKNSQTLYWVGRTGNWSNPANWSLSSGGAPSGCLPSLIDDVVFDANSFNANGQIVTLNTLNSFCKNMTWTSNIRPDATMAGRDSIRLNINGSLEFAAAMKQEFKGSVFFIGSGQHTIKVAGKKFNADLIFNNPAGTWRLLDDIYVEEINYLRSGKLIFENISCNFNRFYTDFTTSRAMDLKNSELNFEVRNFKCANFNLNSENLKLDPGKSHIHFRNSSCAGMYISGLNDITFHNITSGCSFFSIGNNWTNNNKFNINHLKILRNAELYIRSNIDSLTLTGGYDIIMSEYLILTVNVLLANNPCNSFINMKMFYWVNSSSKPTIILNKPHNFSRFSLSDIVVQGPTPVSLLNSIDRGGNSGWQFSTTSGRTLYWVGGGGDWNDQNHWSLTSGGPGGECIPTEIDDVIFDNLSFTSNSDIVNYKWELNTVAYCRNLTFNKPGFAGTLTLNILNVYGNLNIPQSINYNVYRTEFKAHSGVQSVFAPNIRFQNFSVDGKSEVILQSPVHIRYDFKVYGGIFDTKGFNMVIDYTCHLGNYHESKKPFIKFKNSNIQINGISNPNNESLKSASFVNVEGDSCRIELTHSSTSIYIDSEECRFGEIVVSNIAGHVDVATYRNTSIRKLILRGNGKFINLLYSNRFGTLTLDTLILSAGKSYNYQSTYTQTINKYLQARGNNCNPISIFSSLSGAKGIINMPASASINMDFVQMRDMKGIGGANFNAGPYSTNINNSNENWTFPGLASLTESVGFLGPDRLICPGMNGVILDANSFTPTETYRWSTGSTSATLNAQNTDNYAVTVTFANNCKVIDTIRITKAQDIGKILPRDTSLCNQSSYTLIPLINDPAAKYLWNTGSSASQLNVTNNGKYIIRFTKDGCTFSDSTQVSFINIQAVNLGNDTSVCQPNKVVLNVPSGYPFIRWQDGSSNQTLTAQNTGLYWVEAGSGQCKVRDSVQITFNPIPTFSLGQDTTFCEGNSKNLSHNIINGQTLWSTGATSSTINVQSSGIYSARVTLNGCLFSDSINITVNPIPSVNLGRDTSLCENTTLALSAGTGQGTVLWSNNSTQPQIIVSSGGQYSVTKTLNGCSKSDTILITYKSIPRFNLGQDTSFCEGNSKTLSHNIINGQTLWSTGATSSTINVQSSGIYFARVMLNGCLFSDSINITVHPIPSLNLGLDTSLCENTTLALSAGTGQGTVLWSNNSTQPQIIVSSGGQYSVTKTLNGCSKSDTINVSYVNLIRPNLGSDTSFCDGNAILLKDVTSFPNVKYFWSDGTTNTTLSASKSGVYWVETSILGCKKRDSININILPLPKVSSPKDYTFCEGKNVSVALQGDFNAIKWDDFPSQQTIVVSSAKIYRYTATKGLCELRSEINVREVKIPDPGIGDYIDKCRGEPQTLSVADFKGNVKWSTGDQSKTIQVITSGTYSVTLTDSGCTKSDSVFIGFFECNGEFLYFPNIINPLSVNGNEKFLPAVAEKYTLTQYKLSVYDRFGNLLFMSEDINNHWDGRQFGNRELQPGVYTYICTASAEGPRKFENKIFTGTITLLR